MKLKTVCVRCMKKGQPSGEICAQCVLNLLSDRDYWKYKFEKFDRALEKKAKREKKH